ncbi:hypothetical protein BHM03_00039090 [Ensete ventricosum]|nr:hypothetical protein BHM03_00039090 [Ensete ventricosum]
MRQSIYTFLYLNPHCPLPNPPVGRAKCPHSGARSYVHSQRRVGGRALSTQRRSGPLSPLSCLKPQRRHIYIDPWKRKEKSGRVLIVILANILLSLKIPRCGREIASCPLPFQLLFVPLLLSMTTARFLSGAPPQIPAWILVRSAPAFFWQSEDAHEHMKKVRKSYLANALYVLSPSNFIGIFGF